MNLYMRRESWAAILMTAVLGPLTVALIVYGLTRNGGPMNPEEENEERVASIDDTTSTTATTEPEPELELGDGWITDLTLVSNNPCCVFNVAWDVEGFEGERTEIDATVVDAETGEAIETATVLYYDAESDSDAAEGDADVPIAYVGSYYVEFRLYDPYGYELDHVDSDVIYLSV